MHDRERTRRLVLPGLLASSLLIMAAMVAAPALAITYASPSPAASMAPTATPSPTATPTPPASVVLTSGSGASDGSFLVGPNGMTLYTLSSETSTGSVCTGGCLAAWPPLLVAAGGSVTGPAGATGTFSTITRADGGATQVAYNGRPLYYFVHDTAAGQANGQGIKAFGGVWLVAALSGAASTVQLGSHASSALGTFLTGANGMTLYTLSSDPNDGTVCTGTCLSFWPPLLVAAGGSATGPAGSTGTFGSFVRADGTAQVTHDGRALYYFAHDTAAGQTNGEGIQGVGGVWHVALAARAVATASPAATEAPTSASTVPPTSTSSTGSGDVPGSLPALLLALLGGAIVTMLTVGALSRRMHRE
jgi:predicted lipoprotein with Yx(FWY)xxD motif